VVGVGWVHDRNTSEVSELSAEKPEPGPRTQRQSNFAAVGRHPNPTDFKLFKVIQTYSNLFKAKNNAAPTRIRH
jgi:hypothetical protein